MPFSGVTPDFVSPSIAESHPIIAIPFITGKGFKKGINDETSLSRPS